MSKCPIMFVVIGGTPVRIQNAHALWCRNEGQNELIATVRLLTLTLLNMEKKEQICGIIWTILHLSMKAKRLGRRERSSNDLMAQSMSVLP